ncbi:TonB-dependent receptor [Alteromonas sp. 345S023]|uniref:TonB-dependent receptor n=1 Tax=Alteromonas profundi TaxID=2696062 RepID=A0A7X5RKF6_9ALTE|nr:TonB-dependent receptor [Alteromonas profundi]NDV90676.1 TonB-dependent receptor [Alteromonas profundi]
MIKRGLSIRNTCASALYVPGLLCTTMAYGQQNELEHIEVHAQKTTQNLQEVPVAVTVISSHELVETVIKDVFDLQNYVPAFSAFQNQSATNSSFSIRGIGTSSQNFGFEPSVGLYVDGVYRSRQNALINDLVDIAAIEVLRGPQGTLFGKNAAAGAMTLTSTLPTFGETNGFVDLLAGNDSLTRLSGGASFTLVDDILAMRVSGFSTHSDGFITEQNASSTLNNKNRSGVKIQMLYRPIEDVQVRVIADYGELDERCCAALTLQNNIEAKEISGKFGTDALLLSPPFNATIYDKSTFYDFTTSLSQPPRSQMKDKGISAQLDIAFSSAWRAVSISAYRSFDSLDVVDTDFSDANLLTAANDARQQSFSQELRLHYDSENMRAVVGGYYFSQNLDLAFNTTTQSDFSAFFSFAAADLLPLAQAINQLSVATNGLIQPAGDMAPSNTAFFHNAYQQQDSLAVFGQIDWLLSPKLTLTTGLRYTKEDKSILASYQEQGPGIDGLAKDKTQWPNVAQALSGLNEISIALQSGGLPSPQAIAAISPFQVPGWGYYFLGAATVLPRPDLDETLKDNQTTGTLKLSYQPTRNQLIYASMATGYKAGGTNTDRIPPSFSPVFDAEKVRSAEIGVKQDWPNHGVRVNVAAHYTNISDFQATTFDGNGFNLQNAGDISVKGLEVEATWLLTPDTDVTILGARTLASFDSFKQGTCWVAYTWHTGNDDPGRASEQDPFCARDGDRVGFEPQNSAAITVNHSVNIAGLDTRFSAEYQFISDVYLDDSNDPYKYSPAYRLINVRWNVQIVEWDSELTLWARNVFDETYIAQSGFDVPVQAGKIMAYPGAPRSYGVSLRKRF